ncbi:hypothetical protein [Bradyrhizobium sp. BR 10289]|uniref:hypothetical protein n=1 Tax=Bradyrhizobium sp. BR 10289 TaxID=2749993 RepID=UPI001C64A371|nr:hypothetical protein [Bradyrhizobium sp. BR 10289]MBW7970282.1 hypothetical protein [Bradyrhizobium sp. BR 10289]
MNIGEIFVFERFKADANRLIARLENEVIGLRAEKADLEADIEKKYQSMAIQLCQIAGWKAAHEFWRKIASEDHLEEAIDAWTRAFNAKADELHSPELKKQIHRRSHAPGARLSARSGSIAPSEMNG